MAYLRPLWRIDLQKNPGPFGLRSAFRRCIQSSKCLVDQWSVFYQITEFDIEKYLY